MKKIINYLLILSTVLSFCSCKSQKDVDKLIDNREWDKAYELAAKWYVDLPETYVMLPHMTDLVLNGDYTIAKQICTEKKRMHIYFKVIYGNLERIYTSQGEQQLLYALASVPSLNTSKFFYLHGEGVWAPYNSTRETNYDLVEYNNSMLESFFDYLLLMDNRPLLGKVSKYLLYLKDPEFGYDSTPEYNRIKKKFGIK